MVHKCEKSFYGLFFLGRLHSRNQTSIVRKSPRYFFISFEMPNFANMKFTFTLLRGLWWLAGSLPMRLLYDISDVLIFPLLYHVLRYRRRLVSRNLRDEPPERTDEELRRVERDFYHWLADYFVEVLKERAISPDEMRRRMVITNLADIEASLRDEGTRHAFLYLGHFGNWEWVASLPLASTQRQEQTFGQIYHPLHSPLADALFLDLRGRFGARSIAMKETLRAILTLQRQGQRSMVGFISDQSPKIEAMHHWTDFLHHETSFFTGAEKIGQKVGARYFYLDMTRPRRGYYRATLVEIKAEPTSERPFPVTDAYARLLEQSIRATPHLWLWTHNRWKRTRAHWDEYCARHQRQD